MVSGTVARSRIEYERRLAFLGTLGNNAPFVGLFGTVLGIIRAFADLAGNPDAAGSGTVMAGISEALVATAVGLFVALPAVVAYNFFQRALRRATQRAQRARPRRRRAHEGALRLRMAGTSAATTTTRSSSASTSRRSSTSCSSSSSSSW